ncbi:MAG: LacI family transcriptional regulator [Alphaproteobacteria bacterium]|nr:LacI family transcriptional regulator [Alphaproteobacteria bacterium]
MPLRSRTRKQSAATIKDVAELAGVSAMTVSRVLNDKDKVRPETRDRVLASIEALNYTPNLSARGLVKSRSFFIALFYNNPSQGYVSELLLGLLNRCRQAGYHLVIENCGPKESDWEGGIDAMLAASHFDGVILTPPVSDYSSVRAALAEAQLPYVCIAPEKEIGAAPFVETDDFVSAAGMTRHLIELGHQRIGFIKGPPEHGSSAKREAGFRAAMREANLPVSEECVVSGDYSYRSSLEASEALLALTQRPTAIFASNDDMAAAVIATAHRHALSVPDDLSVAGFDDTQIAATIWPHLTTVRQPIEAMAETAMDLLSEAWKADRAPEKAQGIVIPSELVIRDSVAGRKAE